MARELSCLRAGAGAAVVMVVTVGRDADVLAATLDVAALPPRTSRLLRPANGIEPTDASGGSSSELPSKSSMKSRPPMCCKQWMNAQQDAVGLHT